MTENRGPMIWLNVEAIKKDPEIRKMTAAQLGDAFTKALRGERNAFTKHIRHDDPYLADVT